MTYKSLDDVERERNERERKKFKEDAKEDIKDVFDAIFKTPKKIKRKKRWVLFKWLGIIFLFLLLIVIILGLAWLIKFLIQDLFFGG